MFDHADFRGNPDWDFMWQRMTKARPEFGEPQ
jgi:hypothetical protein